ncbi:outer membrane beta-barrel protein [Cecembia sp.]|uniref:outer membrane beta-barrel protein n=1 Tax=Cecembia sp. TaxID=1898110 RepID=UPI0025C67848|nr:outer membrane beta-barrel protein [Cecembia sp.]
MRVQPFLISLCLCFFALAFEAQVFGQTSVGFRGGVSSSEVTYRYQLGRPPINTPGIRSTTFAFVLEHFGQKNAGLQLEIQRITLGYTQENELLQVNQSEWEYLKMPLLSNFYFGNKGRFHIKLGPHFGYLMNAKDVRREFVGNETFLPTYGQPGDDPRRIMYGLNLGAGLSKLFGKSTLAGDVRLSYEFGRPESMDRIFDKNTTTLEISLTYLFQIRKGKWQE